MLPELHIFRAFGTKHGCSQAACTTPIHQGCIQAGFGLRKIAGQRIVFVLKRGDRGAIALHLIHHRLYTGIYDQGLPLQGATDQQTRHRQDNGGLNQAETRLAISSFGGGLLG